MHVSMLLPSSAVSSCKGSEEVYTKPYRKSSITVKPQCVTDVAAFTLPRNGLYSNTRPSIPHPCVYGHIEKWSLDAITCAPGSGSQLHVGLCGTWKANVIWLAQASAPLPVCHSDYPGVSTLLWNDESRLNPAIRQQRVAIVCSRILKSVACFFFYLTSEPMRQPLRQRDLAMRSGHVY